MLTSRQVLAVLAGLVIAVAVWSGFERVMSRTPALPTVPAAQTGFDGEADAGPFWVVERAGELAAALEAAPFVRRGADGPALYMVGFRTCPSCLAFKAAEQDRLDALGIDIRYIVYARADRDGESRSRPEERAIVAELALNRDYDLYTSWYAVSPGEFYQTAELPVPADGDPARTAALDDLRALVSDVIAPIVEANGGEMAVPAFFWQEKGGWRGAIGYSEEGFRPVRDALSGLARQGHAP